jgi:positive regulator of sigma E activity
MFDDYMLLSLAYFSLYLWGSEEIETGCNYKNTSQCWSTCLYYLQPCFSLEVIYQFAAFLCRGEGIYLLTTMGFTVLMIGFVFSFAFRSSYISIN